jgi:hypothetical protein
MAQAYRASAGAPDAARPNPVHFATIALRGVGQVVDMQMTAARVLLQTQARAAAAFGWPDCSDLFDSADDRSRHVFATGAEQVLETARRANDAMAELQRQVGRVVETQAVTAAEHVQRGIEELGTQTQQGIAQLCEAARQTAEEAQQATLALGEAARGTLREGGDQLRSGLQETFQRGREAISEVADEAQQAAGEERTSRRSKAA